MEQKTTRAKMVCEQTTQRPGWGEHPVSHSVEFGAVADGSPENKAFFLASPSGKLSLDTVKDHAFEVGKSYYIDITLAE